MKEPLWSWVHRRRGQKVSAEEVERRLELLRRACSEHGIVDEHQSQIMLSEARLSLMRQEEDDRTLASPWPEDPTDEFVDKWCAALFRRIIRHHRYSDSRERWDDTHGVVHDGIRRLEAWITGKHRTR